MHYIQLELYDASQETFGLHNVEKNKVSLIAGLATGGYNWHTAKLFSNTQLQETEMTPWYAKQWQLPPLYQKFLEVSQLTAFRSLEIPYTRMKTPYDTLKTTLIPENLSTGYC